jgi:hypothetical protein
MISPLPAFRTKWYRATGRYPDRVATNEDWLEAAILWLRAQEKQVIADMLGQCRMTSRGSGSGGNERHAIIGLAGPQQVIAVLKGFAGDDERDAWVRRAFTVTETGVYSSSPTGLAVVRFSPEAPKAAPPRVQGIRGKPGPVEHNGLRFRSYTETGIAEILDDAGVLYFPLPVAVRSRVKVEPDFLIVHQGRVGVLEIDGPHHTPMTRAEEDRRAAWFEKSGVRLVRHYPVRTVDADAKAVVREFLEDLRGPTR